MLVMFTEMNVTGCNYRVWFLLFYAFFVSVQHTGNCLEKNTVCTMYLRKSLSSQYKYIGRVFASRLENSFFCGESQNKISHSVFFPLNKVKNMYFKRRTLKFSLQSKIQWYFWAVSGHAILYVTCYVTSGRSSRTEEVKCIQLRLDTQTKSQNTQCG